MYLLFYIDFFDASNTHLFSITNIKIFAFSLDKYKTMCYNIIIGGTQ
uniref:Uncharacterized protein n=1 Tax=Siphoviridae sp. ctc6d98 TaxID=2825569 RepID=A0A8S5PD35_9CAUD|nr:MAG TPA: hypothetical protein [Siphoviridae sp. ctc6d98]